MEKHVILVERPTNRKKTTDQPAADTQVNEHFILVLEQTLPHIIRQISIEKMMR